MKNLNFYLFSSNYKLAQKLYYLGNLKCVILEKRHFNQNIYNFCRLRNIPIYPIKSIKELDEILPKFAKNTFGISFGIGLFFKQKHIENFEYGILNIHTGKLPDNRGRHPIGWSFINNDKYFYTSVHLINEEIDQGKLVYEEKILRDINDTEVDVINKVDNLIEKNLIENSLNNYFKGNFTELTRGKYNERLSEKFNDINSKDYTSAEIFSIFKSQSCYHKIKINGKTYSNCDFYHEELYTNNGNIVLCQNNEKVVLYEW